MVQGHCDVIYSDSSGVHHKCRELADGCIVDGPTGMKIATCSKHLFITLERQQAQRERAL